MLAHVVGARLSPDRVVDDLVHDPVRVNTGAEALRTAKVGSRRSSPGYAATD